MIAVTHAEASASILRHIDEGRITQRTWHGSGGDGREIACLLGAIHPSVASPQDCNGDLMPMWLAELTPALFDRLPETSIMPIARRYGELVARWHTLSSAQWDSVLARFLIRTIDDAIHAARPAAEGTAYWPAVATACQRTKDALQGESAARAAKAAAEAAAWAAKAAAEAAARAAAESAARAAWAAAYAAKAAAWAAARAAGAAGGAAESAARAAESAARAAAGGAAESAARAARAAAESAARAAAGGAADRMFVFLLDRIEAECDGH